MVLRQALIALQTRLAARRAPEYIPPREDTTLTGAHIVIYSADAEVDRVFFRDMLGFPSLDAGQGWLIFAMPAAELAFHPHDRNNQHELFLVCDNLKALMITLQKKGVRFGEVAEERWGTRTTISLPGGGKLGLYEPKHPVTFGRQGNKAAKAKNTKPRRSRN